jgi:hypothetical protein
MWYFLCVSFYYSDSWSEDTDSQVNRSITAVHQRNKPLSTHVSHTKFRTRYDNCLIVLSVLSYILLKGTIL